MYTCVYTCSSHYFQGDLISCGLLSSYLQSANFSFRETKDLGKKKVRKQYLQVRAASEASCGGGLGGEGGDD